MVKFVWVKFINVRLVNRKHKPCMLAGTAHSLHTEGKKNGLLFSFIMLCLREALIFTLDSFLLPLFLSPLCVMVVYWIIFIKCSVLKLIGTKKEASQELFGSLCFASWSCKSSVTNSTTSIHTWSMSVGAWRLQQKVRGRSVVPAELCSSIDLYK